MTRWQAVVFDLDDTLYPERDFVRGGFRAAARWAAASLGPDPDQALAELWAMFEEGIRGDVFDRWLQMHGLKTEGNREAMVAAYRTHRPRLALYPDVLPNVARLRGRVELGLITEGPDGVQHSKLTALGLDRILPRRVVLDETEREMWKPSPEPFHRWLKDLPIAPDRAIYIGDNPAKDFLGARRAGWASLRLRRSDGLHRRREPATPEAAPDDEIVDLDALPVWLEIDTA